jgi:diguanylate cyclase (GGDEF)-like protein
MRDRQIVAFLEICGESPLDEELESTVTALLRLYCNLLKFLDYGEYDELTGLLNRKTFHVYFRNVLQGNGQRPDVNDELDHARRPDGMEGNRSAWLAVIDIDFFKRINDKFGHLYGDEVLVLVARLMRDCFRDTDYLFRCGGEEFVVILGHMEEEFAIRALERFRAATEAYSFPQVGLVTVSIGYTSVKDGDNGFAAFGRADDALYIAKRQGRNRICCYESLIAQEVLEMRPLRLNGVELF